MKKLLTGLFVLLLSLTLMTGCTEDTKDTSIKKNDDNVKQQENENTKMTTSQKNAVKKAEQYLEVSAFSREGLIKQLEFEKFSNEDATFAVDNIKVDWNEQAVKKAKQYLEVSAFSRDGLIDQLEFEKFTVEQATYGVEQNGL